MLPLHQWPNLVGTVGIEPTCDQLTFLPRIRRRVYVPVGRNGWNRTNATILMRDLPNHSASLRYSNTAVNVETTPGGSKGTAILVSTSAPLTPSASTITAL